MAFNMVSNGFYIVFHLMSTFVYAIRFARITRINTAKIRNSLSIVRIISRLFTLFYTFDTCYRDRPSFYAKSPGFHHHRFISSNVIRNNITFDLFSRGRERLLSSILIICEKEKCGKRVYGHHSEHLR